MLSFKQVTFLIFFSGVVLSTSAVTHAQIGSLAPADCTRLGIACEADAEGEQSRLVEFISNIVDKLLGFVALAGVVMLIIGGLLYIFSFGSEDSAKQAKRIIFYVIIGLLVIAVSAMLINFIIRTFFPAPAP